jgi:hypothetical protein
MPVTGTTSSEPASVGLGTLRQTVGPLAHPSNYVQCDMDGKAQIDIAAHMQRRSFDTIGLRKFYD